MPFEYFAETGNISIKSIIINIIIIIFISIIIIIIIIIIIVIVVIINLGINAKYFGQKQFEFN